MPVNWKDGNAGTEVSEKLILTKTVTIDAVTYYYAYVSNQADESVADAASDYGIRTAADGGGSAKTVYLSDYPTTTDEYMWSRATGRILAKANTTMYAWYKGYGQIRHTPVFTISLPFYMPDETRDLFKATVYRNFWAHAYSVSILGDTATEATTLAVHNTSDKSGDSFNVTIPGSGTIPYSSTITEIENGICFSDYLLIAGNGKSSGVVTIFLYGEIE